MAIAIRMQTEAPVVASIARTFVHKRTEAPVVASTARTASIARTFGHKWKQARTNPATKCNQRHICIYALAISDRLYFYNGIIDGIT